MLVVVGSRPTEVDDAADVRILERRLAYGGFFDLEVLRLQHRRFDGSMSGVVSREVLHIPNASAALPYDPVADRVVLIEQFRAGTLGHAEGPWLLETVAGLMEPGEDAATTARREILEEAGLEARRLERIGAYIASPGAVTEHTTVFIADVSFWRKRPAIVVHDVATASDRRVLERHPSVSAQDWIISTPTKKMIFFGGLAAMKPGIDGIAVTPDGAWFAFGAMSHDTLYRVPTTALLNSSLSDGAVAAQVEAVGHKPLSDGLSADLDGGIWITDVEHGAVLRMVPDGTLQTWVKTPRIRWADALSFGPDGWLYLADSAIPDQVMRSKRHIASQAPYYIFRFRPGVEGVPGH